MGNWNIVSDLSVEVAVVNGEVWTLDNERLEVLDGILDSEDADYELTINFRSKGYSAPAIIHPADKCREAEFTEERSIVSVMVHMWPSGIKNGGLKESYLGDHIAQAIFEQFERQIYDAELPQDDEGDWDDWN
jgi:hypothetical protein